MGEAAPARPTTFEGCAGWLHPAAGETGVVLLSPWGFEALCTRRAFRMLADRLAGAGYPTLRFDWRGTGDSLGGLADVGGLDELVASARAAAETLRQQAGVRRIVLAGQGLGAAVAPLAAPSAGAAGVALLAPVGRGRDHLRELSVWGAMVADSLGFAPEPGSVAGFALPDALAREVAALDLGRLVKAPAPAALVAARPGRVGDQKLAAALRELGCDVQEVAYEGYEAAIGNPTAARPPVALIDVVANWMAERFPTTASPQEASAAGVASAVLQGDGFTEELARLGPGERLAGVLCEPEGPRIGATVLMLSAGGDPHIGWARANVEHARALAREGVASLRLDAADVGDGAGPLSGEPPKLYADGPIEDALAAVDWLEARGFGPVLLTGRCSGAFSAFNAAVRDSRICDLVLVNQRRFVWDRDGTVELATDQVGHYQRQAKDPVKLLKRALSGEIDLLPAVLKLARAAAAMVLGKLGGHGRKLDGAVKAAFGALKGRNVRMVLLYARDGEAHRDFIGFFGEDGRRLRKCADIELAFLDDADHGLTPRHARDALLSLLKDRALWPPSVRPVDAEDVTARAEDLALRPGSLGGVAPAH
ncbi:serine aminopeptidase domain-containing protein [Phenylobacterium sp.]|jgi:alpha/beta superfamily hydrolase|uniref:serine aminopeptidase domain-containing protein n=1 Tax=Phenylobacterium sp. TaxID=1871053 RepID=UPI002F930AAB